MSIGFSGDRAWWPWWATRETAQSEADVLRDEGEQYADRLRAAGNCVTVTRYQGIIHDFVVLNALSDSNAGRAAIAQTIHTLRTAFATDD